MQRKKKINSNCVTTNNLSKRNFNPFETIVPIIIIIKTIRNFALLRSTTPRITQRSPPFEISPTQIVSSCKMSKRQLNVETLETANHPRRRAFPRSTCSTQFYYPCAFCSMESEIDLGRWLGTNEFYTRGELTHHRLCHLYRLTAWFESWDATR